MVLKDGAGAFAIQSLVEQALPPTLNLHLFDESGGDMSEYVRQVQRIQEGLALI